MPTTQPRSVTRRASAVGLGLALAFSAAACGSSGSSSGASATKSSADTTGTFCDTYLKIDHVAGAANTDSPEGAKKLGTAITPDVQTLQSNTPDALTKPVAVLAKGVAAAAGGKSAALQSDGFQQASNQTEAWMHANCNYQNIDVTGVDYKYNGLPATVKAGKTSLAFKNATSMKEMHMALVVKPKKGVTQTLDQLLALPQDQVESKVDVVASPVSPPGKTSGALLDLTPGTYFVLCPLPVGGKNDGAPHFTKGMSATFTVS